MVYGDHGRKLLHPMTTMNRLATFPFSEFYSKLLHFRVMMRTGAILMAGYGYFAYKQGNNFNLIQWLFKRMNILFVNLNLKEDLKVLLSLHTLLSITLLHTSLPTTWKSNVTQSSRRIRLKLKEEFFLRFNFLSFRNLVNVNIRLILSISKLVGIKEKINI